MSTEKAPMSHFKDKLVERQSYQFTLEGFLRDVFEEEFEEFMEAVYEEPSFNHVLNYLSTDNYDYHLSLQISDSNGVFEMRRVVYQTISPDGRTIKGTTVLAAKMELSCDNSFAYTPASFTVDDVDLNMAGVSSIGDLVHFIKVRGIKGDQNLLGSRLQLNNACD